MGLRGKALVGVCRLCPQEAEAVNRLLTAETITFSAQYKNSLFLLASLLSLTVGR